MRKEKVILTSFAITQVGQIQGFQVKIPRDAKRIIGIESSVSKRILMPAPGGGGGGGIGSLFVSVNPNPIMGEFKLQSSGDANIIFADTIYSDDANIGQGDFSATMQFPPKDFTHLYKPMETEANEDGSATLIKGIYTDKQNPVNQTYTYNTNIYVWVELYTPKK